ncbi:hypothetical protein [Bacillus toyonensis]|uniref:hypothetical protein n=1 Tax=Bacillus toyonensis TaxID=155322 RepID=UPI000BF1CE3E|nr:hypothetical protein [Bacillus toyonensis]PEL61967.1 hypothetical protein CN633_08290 [Bacillus toyonensis]
MGKFLISYAASLLAFIIIWFLIPYISNPSYSYENDLPNIFGFIIILIIILIIFGSILDLVACLIGEVLYRNIKQCRKFRFGIPVFIGLALIYICILSLFTITSAYASSLVAPIIMGCLAFYLVRRKI